MEKEDILELVNSLNLQEKIELDSIPNLDLYMDQVITLFEEKLGHTKRFEGDKLLTKTMINNYIKDKLLMPAVKKKYTKEHVLLMILLYDLKQILTIGDIKSLFGTIIKNGEVDGDLLTEIYQIFLALKVEGAYEFNDEIKKMDENIDSRMKQLAAVQDMETEQLKSMLQVIILTEKANYYKRLAEKIIDTKINE